MSGRAVEMVLIPLEPTPEMIAAAVVAVLPDPHPNDYELARAAARIIMQHPQTPPDCTIESLAGAMATIIPAHRAMLAAAPETHTAIALARAVNAHDDLLSSLREVLDLCAVGDVDEDTEALGWGAAIKRANAAMAKATGGTT